MGCSISHALCCLFLKAEESHLSAGSGVGWEAVCRVLRGYGWQGRGWQSSELPSCSRQQFVVLSHGMLLVMVWFQPSKRTGGGGGAGLWSHSVLLVRGIWLSQGQLCAADTHPVSSVIGVKTAPGNMTLVFSDLCV